MKDEDVLMRALKFSKQSKAHLSFLAEANESDIEYIKTTSKFLLDMGLMILEELLLELKNSGWWRRRVVNSWILDTQKMMEKIAISQALLEAKYEN